MIQHAHPDLDAYLDGELEPYEEAAVEAHVARCDHCAAEFALARRMRDELSVMRSPCPDTAFDAAIARIAGLERDRPPMRRLQPRRLGVAAAAAVLIVGGALYLRPAPATESYSAEEIAEARLQVELAFGLVGRATHEASDYIRQEIFPNHIVEPLHEGFDGD